MTRHWDPADDRNLAVVLQGANAPLEHDSFVAVVMRRVRRRLWIRRCVLGTAAALGIAVAFEPLAEAPAALALLMESAPTLVSDRQWLEAQSQWLALLAVPLLWPLVRWLAR